MTRATLFALLFAMGVSLLGGCFRAPLDRRWSGVTGSGEDSPPGVVFQVSATASSDTKSASLSIKDLPERAAAAYIDAIAKHAKGADDVKSAIASPIQKLSGEEDRTAFPRVLVFTVSKKEFSPADRIVQMRLTLTPRGNWIFSDLAATETSYSQVAIDKIDTKGDTKLSAELDPNFLAKLNGKGVLSSSIERSTEDSSDIVHRTETLTVNIDGKKLVIYREGERGYDLTGNTLIKISMRASPLSPIGRNDDEIDNWVVQSFEVGNPSAWKHSGKATINLGLERGLNPIPFEAVGRLEYVLRHVTAGAETYREDDDEVTFVRACVQKIIELVSPAETAFPLWQIVTPDHRKTVMVETDNGCAAPSFPTEEDAARFANWLTHERPSSISHRRLWLAPAGACMGPPSSVSAGAFTSQLVPWSVTPQPPESLNKNGVKQTECSEASLSN